MKILTNKKFIIALVIIVIASLVCIAVINSLYNENAMKTAVGMYYLGKETNTPIKILYTAEFGTSKIAVVERGFGRLGWVESCRGEIRSGGNFVGYHYYDHAGYFDSEYFAPDLYQLNLSSEDENENYVDYRLIVNKNNDIKTIRYEGTKGTKIAEKELNVSASEGQTNIQLVNMSEFRDKNSIGWVVSFYDKNGLEIGYDENYNLIYR